MTKEPSLSQDVLYQWQQRLETMETILDGLVELDGVGEEALQGVRNLQRALDDLASEV
jgi:hypothetical protein